MSDIGLRVARAVFKLDFQAAAELLEIYFVPVDLERVADFAGFVAGD